MKQKTLYICGFGLYEKQITLETIEIINKSEIVISPSIYRKSIFSKKLISVGKLPVEKIIELLNKLFKRYKTITFIVYGNPGFLNSITVDIKRVLKDVNIFIIPAVSSFDCIINLLENLNLIKSNLIISNLNHSIDLNPKYDMLLFSGEVLKSKEKLEIFKKRFIKKYHKRHYFFIIAVKDYFYNKNYLLKTTVKKLEKDIFKIEEMSTIYIPRIKNEKKRNIYNIDRA